MRAIVHRIVGSQESGLVLVVALVTLSLALLAGSHPDRLTGATVNNFWNANTLVQTATDASFFAIMAIGATMVIISGGIDLSVGSIYALAGVTAPFMSTFTPLFDLVSLVGVWAMVVGAMQLVPGRRPRARGRVTTRWRWSPAARSAHR